jgi:Na+-transporting methylmalonyl-CoA/oxaloacetate decarboxylase gamma subunit
MDDIAFWAWTTVVGMAIVFSILALVWLLLTVLMRLDARAARRAAAGVAVGAGGAAAGSGTGAVGGSGLRLRGAPPDLDPRLIAAITIAIVRHEEARRLQAAPAMRSYWPGSLLFASRWVAAGRTRQGQSWRRRR